MVGHSHGNHPVTRLRRLAIPTPSFWTLTVVCCLLAIALLPLLGATASQASERRHLQGNEEVLTGRHVDVADHEASDLLVAAQSSKLERLTLEDLAVAAGRVKMTDITTENLLLFSGFAKMQDMSLRQGFLLGNSLTFGGDVSSDLAMAAGWITLQPETIIGGRLRVAAANFLQQGQLLGDLVVVARKVTLNGEISGNLRILAEKITIAPAAVIHGNISYRSLQEVEVQDGATVLGDVQRVKPHLTLPSIMVVFLMGLAVWAAVMLSVFLLGGSLQIAVPHIMTRPACAIESHPLKTTFVGALVLCGVPVVMLFLAISLWALPLAMMILPLYWGGCIIAFLGFAYWAGLHLIGQPALCWGTPSLLRRLAALLLCLLVVTLAGAVFPIFGLAIFIVGASAGLGAYLLPPPKQPEQTPDS
ncbi:bactofilin family protein [Rhodovibrionaceae bacterium A322]